MAQISNKIFNSINSLNSLKFNLNNKVPTNTVTSDNIERDTDSPLTAIEITADDLNTFFYGIAKQISTESDKSIWTEEARERAQKEAIEAMKEQGYSEEMLGDYFEYSFNTVTGEGSYTLKDGITIESATSYDERMSKFAFGKAMSAMSSISKYSDAELVNGFVVFDKTSGNGTAFKYVGVFADGSTVDTGDYNATQPQVSIEDSIAKLGLATRRNFFS